MRRPQTTYIDQVAKDVGLQNEDRSTARRIATVGETECWRPGLRIRSDDDELKIIIYLYCEAKIQETLIPGAKLFRR